MTILGAERSAETGCGQLIFDPLLVDILHGPLSPVVGNGPVKSLHDRSD